MKENIQEKIDKREKAKKSLLRFSCSFLCVSLLFIGVFCLEVYGPMKLALSQHKFRILSDSFFVAGALPTLFWLLIFVYERGAFDLVSYSVKKFLVFAFRINPKKSNACVSYRDYVNERRKKAKKPRYEFLIVGCLLLLLGVFFAFLS